MDPRLQKRIQRYGWDRASGDYARYWRMQLEPVQTRLLELADLHTGEKVLDVACGDGLVSFRASESVGPQGTVVGDDISSGMIRHAEALRVEKGAQNLRFERRDAEAPVTGEKSFRHRPMFAWPYVCARSRARAASNVGCAPAGGPCGRGCLGAAKALWVG